MLRSNALILQETTKRNLVQHPAKLSNILGYTLHCILDLLKVTPASI